jgi:lipoprotein-anchoring transpeptidase ErfK/SrfK
LAFIRVTVSATRGCRAGIVQRLREFGFNLNRVTVMRLASVFFAFVMSLFFVFAPAQAQVSATVSLSKQTMTVKVDGKVVGVWRVSTGKRGYGTPRGTYGVKRMHARYFSRKYNNAPMHYAVFFRGGYAVHATNHVAALGRPASHGCVRLAPGNARTFFALVSKRRGARISIVG